MATEQTLTEVKTNEAGPWRDAWRSFKKSKISLIGAGIVLLFIILAILAPMILGAIFFHACCTEHVFRYGSAFSRLLARLSSVVYSAF